MSSSAQEQGARRPYSPGHPATRPSPVGWLLIWALTGYQRFVSPMLAPRCRFYPSCSAYALEAVRVHGGLRGSWLAARRLSRCHPFHAGGLDPVPGRKESGRARPEAGNGPVSSMRSQGASR